jgi:hypothetical protein
VLNGLPVGQVVLFAPATMTAGETRQVDANVGINVPMEKLQKTLRSGDQKLDGVSHLSAKMAAILGGPGFEIRLLSPEEQLVAAGFPTSWSWSVKAQEHGEQELTVTLYALLDRVESKGGIARQRVDSYSQKINVDVRAQTWGEWFEAFGKQFDTAKTIVVSLFGLTTVVVGWLGYLATRRKKRQSPVSDLVS